MIDEPSIVDFAPQHQSTCGFPSDEERPGFRRFGPQDWEGNAIVTGESLGIVNPNAALNPDHLGFELELNNGEMVSGTITSDGPSRFLVQQAGVVSVAVPHADIKATRQLSLSLMPAGFEALGEETLRDLITFLITAGKQ